MYGLISPEEHCLIKSENISKKFTEAVSIPNFLVPTVKILPKSKICLK